MDMLFIKNGYIKTMVGEDIPNGSILIQDGKIAAVGADLTAPEGAEVIDAGGRIVSPGFVDAHTHIGLHEEGIGFEGADYNESVDPCTPQMRAIDAINPACEAFDNAIHAGITTACTGPGSANVGGGTFVVLKLYGHRVDDMIVKYPAAMKIAFGENPKRVYNGQNKSPKTRMATAAILRELLFKAQRYKEEKDKPAADPSAKEPTFDMKLEAMLPVMRHEIPLKAHAHRADDIYTSIRIAREFGLDITLDHCTEGHLIAEDLAKENLPIFVGPSLTAKSKYELRNKTFETPAILAKAGLIFGIITDNPVIPLQYLPLCAGLAVKSGLDPEDAWRAITAWPAKLLGVDNRVGSIAPGLDADIVIHNGNPLFDIGSEPEAVIVDGKRIV